MPTSLFKYRIFVVGAALAAMLWLLYLSMMVFEHRKVLKEMGVI